MIWHCTSPHPIGLKLDPCISLITLITPWNLWFPSSFLGSISVVSTSAWPRSWSIPAPDRAGSVSLPAPPSNQRIANGFPVARCPPVDHGLLRHVGAFTLADMSASVKAVTCHRTPYAWCSKMEFAAKWSDRMSETITIGVPGRTRSSLRNSSLTRSIVTSMLDANGSLKARTPRVSESWRQTRSVGVNA